MFNADAKIIQRMTPMLQRVMIVDPQPAGARLIGELMRDIARSQIWTAETHDKAIRLTASYDPHVIFVDLGPAPLDGIAFTRELRRSHLSARYAPVIMVTGQATAAGILASRDAGVHEFLRRPFTIKDLLRRLEAVTLRPRDWVEAVDYVGPDRRRFNSGDYSGALKRRSDATATPDAERLAQALKILRSAIAAVASDPAQAMRALQAQVAELRRCGMSIADLKLTSAAIDFGRYLDEIEVKGAPYDRAALEVKAGALLAYMPKEEAVAA
ncbi:response regulator [Phenylobacterium sp.]|uniref:response regulator n=1 Tax=Phenylobacterium sp. TaxID=1871053 RepID=UPI00286C19D2|nr:response regulator [Phenylobacterium sp.]